MARRHAGATPATLALGAAGIAFTLHEYDHDPRAESFGLEAAEALGLDPERVLKTLVASVDGRLAVAVVPVAGRLDLKALARALGGSRAALAERADAERATGLRRRRHLPRRARSARTGPSWTASALDHPSVFVSAGRRGLDLEIAPADLVRVTAAITHPVRR